MVKKVKKDKTLVKVYYRLVDTSSLIAALIVIDTQKEVSTTLARAEQVVFDKDKIRVKIIGSDVYVPEPPDDQKSDKKTEEVKESDPPTKSALVLENHPS